MNDSTVNRMIRDHKAHVIWVLVLLVLAVFVTALVFGTLKRSVQAQTYTKRVFECPYAEEGADPVAHRHNDDCYENGVLICTLPELEAHTHTAECFEKQEVLICGQEENDGHVHTDACYADEQVLVCGQEENDGHVHSVENGCYTLEQGDLICTDEDPDHVHTDDCYTWNEVLTCEIPEGEGAHHHDESCYETQTVLICGMEEGEGAHHHDETCYEEQLVPVCGKEALEEHVHTVDCFKVVDMTPEEIHAKHMSELPESDPTADVESPADWESRFASVPLSGNWDRDLLKIAETQLGYRESERNFEASLDEDGEGYTVKGWTRYGAWYGIPYGDWCCMFISFCLNYADIPETAFPYDCATTTWIDSLSDRGMYAPAGSYDPKPGDLIFFDWESDGLADHVGIVWAVNPDSITTIEGNHTSAVELFDYALYDSHIQGYGILPENPDAPKEEEDAAPADNTVTEAKDNKKEAADADTADTADITDTTANTDSASTETAEAKPAVNMPPFSYSERVAGMRVSIDADEGAFPEGTTVVITAIEDDGLAEQVAPAVTGRVVQVQAVDITFYDADGNEIEPLIPIRVTMRPFTETEADNVGVVHVGNDGTVSAVETQNDVAQPDQGVAFSADSFSTYALVYTVNFEFDANGEIYRYSFAGGTTTSLRQLLLDSGMRTEETVDGYLDYVVYVSFSNPEYMEVTQSGNDWLVKSLHAFDSAECLTITLSDGRMIGIPVTVTGIEELQLENAVISSSDGVFLPEGTEGHADVVEDAEETIAAVEAYVEDNTPKQTAWQRWLNRSKPAEDEGGKAYQVFDIGLDNIDTNDFKDGFNVEVKLPEGVVGHGFELYHVHDDVVEKVDMELVGIENENGTQFVTGFSFQAENFSEFTLRYYTVDFEKVDGGKYSIPGGSSILLSELADIIGLPELGYVKEQVVNVDFSNPELVRVTSTGDDWLLESLVPFSTEETLTIELSTGKTIVVNVTDIQSEAVDLKNCLTTAVITVDGQPVSADTWTVRANENYTINLRFAENSAIQFPDDKNTKEKMYYQLPDGFEADEINNKTFNIKIGPKTVQGNTYSIIKDSNGKYQLIVNWNWNDPNIDDLLASKTAAIKLDITGTIQEGTSQLNFSQTITKEVEADNSHNVSVDKSGYYNSEEKKIHYTVTVRSSGENENVVVTDRITGRAVEMKSDDKIKLVFYNPYSETDISSAKSSDGKGFEHNLGTMTNGQVATFYYTASVDIDKLSKSGATTFDETGNTISLKDHHDDNPDDDSKLFYVNYISFGGSTIRKNSTRVDGIFERDGKKYKTVTWKITENSEKAINIGGSSITDKIAPDSIDKMKYSGDGIKVSINDGTPVDVSWATLGVDINSATTWTYNIPDSVGKDKIEITYTTDVEITDVHAAVTVNNTVDGKPGSTLGSAPVNQGQGQSGDETGGPATTKIFTYVSDTEIEWKVSVNVDKDGYDKFYVEDRLPQAGYNHYYFDSINDLNNDIIVEGLLPGESWTSERLTIPINTNVEGTWQDVDYDAGVKLTFYKNVNGVNVPGLLPNDEEHDRIITITLKTKVHQQWLEECSDNAGSGNGLHINNVDVFAGTEHSHAESSVNPRKKKITKSFMQGSTVTIGGIDYPAYKYQIDIEGVYESGLEITDTFDTDAFMLFVGNADTNKYQEILYNYNKVTGSIYAHFGDSEQRRVEQPSDILVSTATGFKINTDDLPRMPTGGFYPFYRIEYYLVPKGLEGLNYMKSLAIAEGGEVTFCNEASFSDGTSSVDITYTYKPLAKDAVYDPENQVYTYTIILNKDKNLLNYGFPMIMTDEYEHMIVDYRSITVTTDPAGREGDITWDYQGNKGTFNNIPDATTVYITYDARPIGTGTVHMRNTAELQGYSVVSDREVTVSSQMEGSAHLGRLYLLKYAKGDMTVPLAGATFGLYDENMQPLTYGNDATHDKKGQHITFSTDEKGEAEIFLSQSVDGWTFDIEYTDDLGNKYLGKKYFLKEETAPDGYEIDNTWYSFVITEDPSHVQYDPSTGTYIYLNGDVLKVWDNPKTGIRIKKVITGFENLTEAQKENITFQISGPGGYSKTLTYKEFTGKYYKLPDAADNINSLPVGSYTVTESINGGYEIPESTTVKVDDSPAQYNSSVTFEITEEDIQNNTDRVVTFTNNYPTAEIKIKKTDMGGSYIPGAVFKLERKENGVWCDYREGIEITSETGTVLKSIFDGDYRLTETAVPTGYTGIDPVEFTVNGGVVSGIDNDQLILDGNTISVKNEKLGITVKKEWVGPPSGSSVTVKLEQWNQTYWNEIGTVITLDETNNWEYQWNDLDVLVAGEEARYRVTEVNVPSEYSVSYTVSRNGADNENLKLGDIVTVTNTKITTGIAVYKKWDVRSDNDMKPVTVELRRGTEDQVNSCKLTIGYQYLYEYLQEAAPHSSSVLYVKPGTSVYLQFDNKWKWNFKDTATVSTASGCTVSYDNDSTVTINVTNNNASLTVVGDDDNILSTIHLDYTPLIIKNDNDPPSVAELNKTRNWYYEWPTLPDGDGIYYIVETKIDGKAVDPDEYLVTYSDNNENGIKTGTIVVTNKKMETGSLKITKQVTVGGKPTTGTLADGTYKFVIRDAANNYADGKVNGTAITDGKISITILNGVSTTVEVTDLKPGDYTIIEEEPDNHTALTGITGGKEDTKDLSSRQITVTVEAGKTGESIAATGGATFTNNLDTTDFIFSKEWVNSGNTWPQNTAISVTLLRKTEDDEEAEEVASYTISSNNEGGITITQPASPKPQAVQENGEGYVFKICDLLRYPESGNEEYKYFVTETTIPEYYVPTYMSPSGVGGNLINTSSTLGGAQHEGKIINTETLGYELPQTGGPGTALYTLLGGLIAFTAGAVLTLRRKKNKA